MDHEIADAAMSDVGRAIAAARKARRLTQLELARQSAISLSLLRKIERGNRSLTPDVQTALSSVLGPIAAAHEEATMPTRIGYVLPLLREIMDCYDVPADPPSNPKSLPELRRITGLATMWRLSSQYVRLAELLPGLITDLTTRALTGIGHEREQAFGQLALAYRAADAIADKHGYHDLSARATELIRWAATHSGDPLLEMMSAYVRAELFFTGAHARAGLRILDNAVGRVPPAAEVPQLAMYGALSMRAGVLAVRAGMPEEAADRMADARAAARHLPDGVYNGTAFGPSSVRIHELAAAVENGDISRALRLAAPWQPPQALPAERRSHFHIEAARAYRWAGHRDEAVAALWQARYAAPQHTRCNPVVAETVESLVRSSRKPPPDLLQLANWIGLT